MRITEDQSIHKDDNLDWFNVLSDDRIQSIMPAIFSRLVKELPIEGVFSFHNQKLFSHIPFLSEESTQKLIQELQNNWNGIETDVVRYLWLTDTEGYLLYVLYKQTNDFMVVFLDSHSSYTNARKKVFEMLSLLKNMASSIMQENIPHQILNESINKLKIQQPPTKIEIVDIQNTAVHQKTVDKLPSNYVMDEDDFSEEKFEESLNLDFLNNDEKLDTQIIPDNEQHKTKLSWENEIDPIIWETGYVEGVDVNDPLFDDVPLSNPENDIKELTNQSQENPPKELSETYGIPTDWLPEKGSIKNRTLFINDLLDDSVPIDVFDAQSIKFSEVNLKKFENDYQSETGSKYNLKYVALLVTRFPNQTIKNEMISLIKETLIQICLAFNWRLEKYLVKDNTLCIVADVEPKTSPKTFISTISKYTSQRMFENFPEEFNNNLSKKFWAEDYLLENQSELLSLELIKEFTILVRKRQGIK